MGRFCIIILARANHFFPLEKGSHQLFMGLERNMRARNKGKNHQDNYTKATNLKFVFTAKEVKVAKKRRTVANGP
jgi:hypothetical protein